MDKQCPECGATIRSYQTRCVNCQKRQRNVVHPKKCRVCGETFLPRTNHFMICETCLAKRYSYQKFQESEDRNPCSTCFFLNYCKELIHDMNRWPPCWACSPERDQFVEMYLGASTYQNQMARTLAMVCEMEVVE